MESCCEGSAFVDALGAGVASARTVLEVEGASCGACVARIESALKAVPGVAGATFDLASRRARIDHGAQVDPALLRAAIAKAGYAVRTVPERDRRRERRVAFWRMGVAGLAMMQVMMLAWPAYVADAGTLSWDIERLLAIAALLVTLPVVLFSAAPIWVSAWRAVRAGHVNMDVSVSLGILAAFVASLPATFAGGEVYYDAVTMFVFFLTAGRLVEAKALAATQDAAAALAAMLPRRAVRLGARGHEEVDAALLVPGDRVWIPAGEAAPADCTLESGVSDFNESLLTGESAPAAKRVGDAILAGSVNLAAPVEARVDRAGDEHTLAQVQRLVEAASSAKPRWALLADRVAARFVAGVIALAACGAIAWAFIDPSRALAIAVTVLVVSCPCALALATPVAFTAAANALARRGVLVTRGAAIETLAAVDRVVLDKTGTLTTGRMRISSVDVVGDLPRARCLAIAAAMERAMPHPLAHALTAAWEGPALELDSIAAIPGQGVEASLEGHRYRVGSIEYCEALAGRPWPGADDGAGPVAMLSGEGQWLAAFHFDDTLRPEAPDAVARLRELGCEATLLSGDRLPVVDRVARSTRIADARARQSPADKVAAIESFAGAGEVVAMVGDGVNDAPSLARAAVSIAMGQGAGAARARADFIMLGSSLEAIPAAIAIARRTRRVVTQNLGWAVAYNAATLPLALAGMLSPWMASLGMSVSSLVVVANALRIARTRTL